MVWTTPGGTASVTVRRDKLAAALEGMATVLPEGTTTTYQLPWRPTK